MNKITQKLMDGRVVFGFIPPPQKKKKKKTSIQARFNQKHFQNVGTTVVTYRNHVNDVASYNHTRYLMALYLNGRDFVREFNNHT